MSKISDAAKNAKTKAGSQMNAAKKRAAESGRVAKQKAGQAYSTSRNAAARGAENSKQFALNAQQKSGETVDGNPLVSVASGLALGAIIGALLPTTQRERKLMGETSKKINGRASAAIDAAKEAGRERMSEVGLNAEQAKAQVKNFVDKASETAKAASQAAKDSAKSGS